MAASPRGIYHDGADTAYFAQQHGGPGTVHQQELGDRRLAGAAIGASTGTDQAELEIAVHDNSGKPFASYRYGSAVTTAPRKSPSASSVAVPAPSGCGSALPGLRPAFRTWTARPAS